MSFKFSYNYINSINLYFLGTYSFNLEKAMARRASTLALKIPWTEEPRGLQSMGSLKVGHNRAKVLLRRKDL